MNSSVQMTAPDSLALLLGLGGRKIPADPCGASGFGALLNLAPPPTAADGNTRTPILNPGKAAESSPDTMIPIIISDAMLSLLGQPATSIPNSDQTGDMQQLSEGPVMAGAELLAPDDGSGDTVYVRIQSQREAGSNMPELPDNDDERQETLLPIRLRTVEQRDGRLIADGELLTAAGKDIPIRLQLQAVEKPLMDLQTDAPASENGTQVSSGHADTGRPTMARMLANLNVEMMVIEPAVAETTPELRMPFADIMGRMDRTIKTGEPAPSASTTSAVSSASPSGTQASTPILPMMPTASTPTASEGSPSPVQDIPAGDVKATEVVDMVIGCDDTSSNAIKTDGIPTPPASTLTAPLDASGIGDAQQQSEETPQVRFYDIDHKLDQLKQNPGQRIKIQLIPSNLGKMELSIVSHRGLVTVNLALESTQAKEAVERNLPQLEQRLAMSGIKVDAVQLQVNHPSRGSAFANAQQHYHQDGSGGTGGRGSHQSSYRSVRQYRMQMPDTGFKQELVNCLA